MHHILYALLSKNDKHFRNRHLFRKRASRLRDSLPNIYVFPSFRSSVQIFFSSFFPTISLLSFQVVLSLKHLFYIFRKFCSKLYLVPSQKCPYAQKVAWLSTRRNFGPKVPTKLSESPYRKSFVVP